MVLAAPALAERSLGQGRRDVNWLPYHRFEITSSMKRQDAVQALAAHVEPVKWFRFGWPNKANDKRFEGVVSGDSFEIQRVMGYRNSFAPAVRGEVKSAGAMTQIVITMRPMLIALIFIGVWIFASITVLITAGPVGVISIVMMLFLYAMVMGGFWFEANKQEATLREIFRAL